MTRKRKYGAHNSKKHEKKMKLSSLSKKHRKHLEDFGEQHPSEDRDTVTKYTKVKDEDDSVIDSNLETEASSESEDEDAYSQLLSSIQRKKSKSDSSSDESEDVLASDESEDENEKHSQTNSEEDQEDYESESEMVEDLIKNSDISENEDSDEEESDNEIENETTDAEDDAEDFRLKETDPFSIHFEKDLSEDSVEQLSSLKCWVKKDIKIPHLGNAICYHSEKTKKFEIQQETDLKKKHVKHKLCAHLEETNRKLCDAKLQKNELLTSQQLSLFSILNNYQDLYMCDKSHENGEEIRLVYCLHALNHALKTRNRVIVHNTKIKAKKELSDSEEYRDQGLTRPKVLMVLPFRDSALKVVDLMISLLMAKDETFVSNKKRFRKEYGEEEDDGKKGRKPDDYEAIFSGNIDDHFRIGLGVAKKTLKLYTKFYSADIILASPLGLRTIIGAEGEKERDYDFLSSIEILIIDQADVCLMQNWDHITHLMKHMHLQPQESHGVDFSRVRMWTLNGWSKYYRQTLLFSSVQTPEINALFNKHCLNYAGKVQIKKNVDSGSISQIVLQLSQIFHRFHCESYSQMSDARFDFFIKKVLPHHSNPVMAGTFIFIPSYFDFVRIRNYFVREEKDFVQMNEYSKDKNISKARTRFFHKKIQFLLYTERLHFFKRYKMRGIRHIVFYELPHFPHFYSEICNMLQDPKLKSDIENTTCTVLYSKYDAHKLAAVVGMSRAGHMVNSEKSVHMFVTGENS